MAERKKSRNTRRLMYSAQRNSGAFNYKTGAMSLSFTFQDEKRDMEKMGAKKLPFRDVCEPADIFVEAFDHEYVLFRPVSLSLRARARTKNLWPVPFLASVTSPHSIPIISMPFLPRVTSQAHNPPHNTSTLSYQPGYGQWQPRTARSYERGHVEIKDDAINPASTTQHDRYLFFLPRRPMSLP